MTCQEVMEEMQRQLDGDLNERELAELTEHTKSCPDCSAMYERLQRLSNELENLPKVVPAYSLVDAILPELDRIDAELEAAEPEPAAPAGGAGADIGPRGRARTRRRWTDRASFRALAGVIAAGVVAGIFLVTYHPGDSRNGDFALESTSTADRSAADDGSATSEAPSASMKKEAPDESLQTEEQFGSTFSATDPNGAAGGDNGTAGGAADDASAQDRGTADGKAVVPKSSPAKPDKQADKSDAARGETEDGARLHNNFRSTEAEDAPTGTGKAGRPEAGANAADAADTGAADDGAAETAPAQDAPAAAAESDAPAADSGTADAVPPEHYLEPDKLPAPGGNAAGGGKLPGIAAVTTIEVETPSPDGTYKAVVGGGRIAVRTVSDGMTVFESGDKTGTLEVTAWAADSRSVTYRVTADDGTASQFVIDIPSLSERELASDDETRSIPRE